MDAGNTSGYSSIETSPQSSNNDLLKSWKSSKIRLQLKRRDISSTEDVTDEEEVEEVQQVEEEEEVDYRPVVTPNEIEPHKEWYHKLWMFKQNFRAGERGAFPPFPPPPLPSTMIAASQAFSVNTFDETKKAAVSHETKSPASISLLKREHRFRPADFRLFPPPHVYLQMIKTLAPHQYVDLTYALAGAVLLELGFRIPEYYPPLPPRIEPFRDLEAEERAHMTEASSQSSTDGEYSDVSEHSRFIERLKRRKNVERRAAREIRITAKKTMKENKEEARKETFSRESIYKDKTLATFIPRPPNRRPSIPPCFLPPDNKRGPFPLPPPFFPFPPMPIHLLSPPETPSSTKGDRRQHYPRRSF